MPAPCHVNQGYVYMYFINTVGPESALIGLYNLPLVAWHDALDYLVYTCGQGKMQTKHTQLVF